MTAKAGQKCTAIRRILVPRPQEAAVIAALNAALAQVKLGDPRSEDKAMGPLVSLAQRAAVRAQVAKLQSEAEIVFGDPDSCAGEGIEPAKGAFISPLLLRATDPMTAQRIHNTEAFGPVATVVAYDNLDQAIELVRRGEGSLVASLFTHDAAVAEAVILGIAPYHGRILVVDRDCARESPGTVRRCPISCMAVPAALAVARNWAVCAPCFITCSARRCRDRRRGCRP